MLAEQADYIIAGFLFRGGRGYVNLLYPVTLVLAVPHGLAVKPDQVIIRLDKETGA